MASIATDFRPAIVGAFLLTLVLVPQPRGPVRNLVSLDGVKRPPVIVAMELDGHPADRGPADGLTDLFWPDTSADVLTPPEHPDAQAWPHGMVIHPPPSADSMAIAAPTVLDRLLSALLAPWLTVAS